ncbi:MAG: CDP-alcohol phosphatidyltransferase family protein [Candidatus Doudnabacteria bacterium]|nr:CDP-alcohol phosphatidyltransferase family protein [Candidatus Doudnabacteria bacterium]
MRWLPNALSITRAALGALVVWPLAYFGQWEWAFWIFVFAAFTDFADGGAAILLKCGTKWGKEVLDPRCDGFLVSGVVLGWILERNHFTRLLLGVLVFVIVEWLYRVKHGPPTMLQRIVALGLPLSYFISLYCFGYYYAHNAYGDAMRRPWIMASSLILPAVLVKLSRFKTWAVGDL